MITFNNSPLQASELLSLYRELALRAFSPVTLAVHSIMEQEKQMPALQSLVFLMCSLYHTPQKYTIVPDRILTVP